MSTDSSDNVPVYLLTICNELSPNEGKKIKIFLSQNLNWFIGHYICRGTRQQYSCFK